MVLALLRGLAGAFSAATLTWIAWGIGTSGDLFAGGKALLALVTMGAAALGGAYLGFKVCTKRRQIVLSVATALCLVFWFVAPSGWWALPPPKANEVHVR